MIIVSMLFLASCGVEVEATSTKSEGKLPNSAILNTENMVEGSNVGCRISAVLNGMSKGEAVVMTVTGKTKEGQFRQLTIDQVIYNGESTDRGVGKYVYSGDEKWCMTPESISIAGLQGNEVSSKELECDGVLGAYFCE